LNRGPDGTGTEKDWIEDKRIEKFDSMEVRTKQEWINVIRYRYKKNQNILLNRSLDNIRMVKFDQVEAWTKQKWRNLIGKSFGLNKNGEI
jgi:hypothetical protein